MSAAIRHIPWQFIVALTGSIAVVSLLVHITTSGGSKKKSSDTETLGGVYNDTVDIYFAQAYEMGLIYNSLNAISNGCTPPTTPIVDPIYNILKLGTLASTTSSWQQLKTQINGTASGQCLFYGFDAMSLRTGIEENPADICHSYMIAALAYFAVNKLTPQELSDLTNNLFNAVLVAYPLNIYWKNTLGANWITDVVITSNTGLNAEILAFYDAFHPPSNGPPSGGPSTNTRTIATRFCNQYFATDQPAYYNTKVQPHMAFPFEGLVNKRAQSDMSPNLQHMMGELTIPMGMDIKRVYILDPTTGPGGTNGLGSDPATLLFIQSMISGGSSVSTEIRTGLVTESLEAIANSIFNIADGVVVSGSVNASKVPVLVFARYIDDVQTYLSFKTPPNTIMFAFSQDDPGDFLGGENLGVLLQNAASHASVNVFDSSISFDFEAYMGNDYKAESQVSDFINLLIGTGVNAGSFKAWGVLDTFAIRNTLVGGNDVGGRLERAQFDQMMIDEGIATGLHAQSFSMDLIQTVTTPSVLENTTEAEISSFGSIFGFSTVFGGGSGAGVVEVEIPSRLDWRELKGACIPPGENQGACNNCWSISSTHAISARLCIQANPANAEQARQSFLSTQQVTACSKGVVTTTDGCNPQQANTGFAYMTGDVTTSSCMSTIFTGKSTNGQCPQVCKDGRAPPNAGGTVQGTYTQLQTAKDIKAALLQGPLAVGISFPTDFFTAFPVCTPTPESYIYPLSQNTRFKTPGGHMMLLIGFDDTTTPKSWIIKNSHGCGLSQTLVQGNQGVIRLAQDSGGIMKGSGVRWVDYNGFIAAPRTRPTDPNTVIAAATVSAPVASSSANLNSLIQGAPKTASVPRTYTATVTCPNMILNRQQAVNQAAIQGCPNSANNLVLKSSARVISPGIGMFWCIFMLIVTFSL